MNIREFFTAERVTFGSPGTTSPLQALRDSTVLMLLTTLAVFLVPEAFREFLTGFGYRSDVVVLVVGGSIATLSLGVIAVVYLRRIHSVTIPLRRPSGREWGWVVVGIVFAVGLLLAIDIVSAAVGVTSAQSAAGSQSANLTPAILLYAIVWSLVAIKPIEEILFRGVIQGRLREALGPATAIGITSIGFGVLHAPSYLFGGSDLLSAGVAIALGSITLGAVINGAIYERTANLAVVILAHGLTDALIFTIFLVTIL